MKRHNKITILTLLALLVPATAFAALDNTSATIASVDILRNGSLYIHLEQDVSNQPSCSSVNRVIGCDLAEPYCESALEIANGAFLSGRTVEFDAGVDCVGTVTRFNRLRYQQ